MDNAGTRTDREIMAALGLRLRALRRGQGLTLAEVAARAHMDRKTVHRAEKGDNPGLETLIRLLRVYGRLDALDDFVPEPTVSPMALLRERRRS
ncbi:MAG TPA: helix-turn-helix transcriptional regulator [Longimicrobiales bacterium]|nr:helix-turn-helix transcriptional regulator [Longimicrobiales bacterium]